MLAPRIVAILVAVAFFAGFVDAIAGGGGLLTVPALLATGMPTHPALGTNKGQSVFGAVASAVSFWRRGGIDRDRAGVAFACGLAGALAGAATQLAIPKEPLRPIALILLVVAALAVVARPYLIADRPTVPSGGRPALIAICLLLGFYDGFFGPGTGSLLIVAFVTFLGDGMTRASGNAKVVNLASNLASMTLFAIKGTIVWRISLPMALGNALGASLGARVALRSGDRFVRITLLVVVLSLVGKLTYDLIHT